jgi:hypothetical protein
MEQQTLEMKGDEMRLENTYLTDPYEIANHLERLKNGKGVIRSKKGGAWGRMSLGIPMEDVAMLNATNDPDWATYSATGDKGALGRLLIRFPYWQVCEGRVL